MLETVSPELNAANLAAFRKGLSEFGFMDGQNLRIEYRSKDATRIKQLRACPESQLKTRADQWITQKKRKEFWSRPPLAPAMPEPEPAKSAFSWDDMTALASQMVSSEARHMLAMKAAQALRTR
jgi:hypothetical protein